MQSVHSLEGTNYYRCNLCKKPCDIKPQSTPYIPKIGDRVSVEGVVLNVRHGILDDANGAYIEVEPSSDKNKNTRFWVLEESYELVNLTLISRPTPKHKITRKELEALVGSEFDIVD